MMPCQMMTHGIFSGNSQCYTLSDDIDEWFEKKQDAVVDLGEANFVGYIKLEMEKEFYDMQPDVHNLVYLGKHNW